jgi:hypothetical protein
MSALRGITVIIASLLLWILPGCGSDSAGPRPSDVSGLYEAVTDPGPTTCEPASAAEVLQAVIGAIPLRITVRVEQLDAQVRMTAIAAEGTDGRPVTLDDPQPIVGPLLADGTVHFTTHLSSPLTLEGRTLFQETTISSSGRFDREADPMTFSLVSSGTNVFREGSTTGPVFATCTDTETTTAIRTGD